MEIKQEEKLDMKPLPQRNGMQRNQQENGGEQQQERKPFNQQNRVSQNQQGGKGGNRGRGAFNGSRSNDQRNNTNRNQGGPGRNNEVCDTRWRQYKITYDMNYQKLFLFHIFYHFISTFDKYMSHSIEENGLSYLGASNINFQRFSVFGKVTEIFVPDILSFQVSRTWNLS